MKIYQVDAFTSQAYKGNPAGVCVLPSSKPLDDTLLQNISAELHVSETAFLSKQNGSYHLRWFTPLAEIDFCGHATLSSAHILWETGLEKKQDTIEFDTLSGKLFARYKNGKIELNFPSFTGQPALVQKRITTALGITPIFSGVNGSRYLFEVENRQVLETMQPDFSKLKKFGDKQFIITCKSEDKEHDFYSRFFVPFIGIDEDPVTGSAHSFLAPYWSRKLGNKLLKAYQASQRGGILECELTDKDRVLIRGQAVIVFEIEMREEHIPRWH